jgi:hypothetical protein
MAGTFPVTSLITIAAIFLLAVAGAMAGLVMAGSRSVTKWPPKPPARPEDRLPAIRGPQELQALPAPRPVLALPAAPAGCSLASCGGPRQEWLLTVMVGGVARRDLGFCSWECMEKWKRADMASRALAAR